MAYVVMHGGERWSTKITEWENVANRMMYEYLQKCNDL